MSCKYCNGTGIWISPIMGGEFPCEECNKLETTSEQSVDSNIQNDEPTSILPSGTKHWKVNGFFHRENGPAIVCVNGYKAWWKNGRQHRIDGPAQIRHDGTVEYWIDGLEYTEHRFKNHPDSIIP